MTKNQSKNYFNYFQLTLSLVIEFIAKTFKSKILKLGITFMF